MKLWKVKPLAGRGTPAVLQAGARQETGEYRLGDSSSPHLSLPASLLDTLGLAPGEELGALVQDSGRRIHLGPLVGVLVNRASILRLQRGLDNRLRHMAAEARGAGALLGFFTIDGLVPDEGAVDAWILRGDNWAQARLPLPDVIYHRATYATPDRRRAARTVLHGLIRDLGVILINGVNAFSKSNVAEALSFFGETHPLSPDTAIFADAAGLSWMLHRHGRVFIKADHSSHGDDVLQVGSVGSRWQVNGAVRSGKVSESFGSPEELHTFLRLLKGGRQWVVQQAIDVAQVEGRRFDLRVIAQKDGEGAWTVPLVLVRWAQTGEVITNTSRGAEALLPADFRSRVLREWPALADFEETARRVALQTALALEARFGRLGEMGVDIALDQDGRPWVLEANSKPLHRQLDGLHLRLPLNPIHYAIFLAERKWQGQHTGLTWI